MRIFNLIAVFLTALLCLSSAYAQDNVKEVPNLPNYYAIGSDPSTAILTTEFPQGQFQSPARVTELAAKIREARTLGNLTAMNSYQEELSRISGSSTTTGQDYSLGTPIQVQTENGQNPPFNDNMINTNRVWGGTNGLWCIATATVPVGWPGAGTIYAASGNYNSTATDTMRYYRSTNGGVTWTAFAAFTYSGTDNFNFVANDLDIELCYNGTDVFLFSTCRVNNATSGAHFLQGARLQVSGTLVYTFYTITYPGATANNNYYNSRLTSDSPRWTGSTYVYLMNSFDTTDGAQRRVRQKYGVLLTPFAAAITVTYRGPTSGGWFWNTAVPAGSYYWGDIVYIDSGPNDRVMTVANFPTTVAFPSMYLAWSHDYGVTIASSISITEAVANITYGARIASNNGSDNFNIMINYTRLFSGVDWDPYYRRTTNGGALTGDWTGGFVDASTARSRYVDIIGVVGGTGHFKSAYIQDSANTTLQGRNFLYRTYNAGAWSGSYRMTSTLPPDTSFGKIRAGYRNGGGDDCFALWSHGNGAEVWATFSCATTVGINGNNNEIPNVYSLSQNYPNPFNPTTNIKFAIPTAGLVKLVVYDVMGREVGTVVNQDMNAGSYTVDFNAVNLATGIYFYTITAGGFKDTKKMMLIK